MGLLDSLRAEGVWLALLYIVGFVGWDSMKPYVHRVIEFLFGQVSSSVTFSTKLRCGFEGELLRNEVAVGLVAGLYR